MKIGRYVILEGKDNKMHDLTRQGKDEIMSIQRTRSVLTRKDEISFLTRED